MSERKVIFRDTGPEVPSPIERNARSSSAHSPPSTSPKIPGLGNPPTTGAPISSNIREENDASDTDMESLFRGSGDGEEEVVVNGDEDQENEDEDERFSEHSPEWEILERNERHETIGGCTPSEARDLYYEVSGYGREGVRDGGNEAEDGDSSQCSTHSPDRETGRRDEGGGMIKGYNPDEGLPDLYKRITEYVREKGEKIRAEAEEHSGDWTTDDEEKKPTVKRSERRKGTGVAGKKKGGAKDGDMEAVRRSPEWNTTDEEHGEEKTESGGGKRGKRVRKEGEREPEKEAEKEPEKQPEKEPKKDLTDDFYFENSSDSDLYEPDGTLKPGGAKERKKRESRRKRRDEYYQAKHETQEAAGRAAEPVADLIADVVAEAVAELPKKRQRTGKNNDGGEGKIQCTYIKPAKGSKPAKRCKNVFWPNGSLYCHIRTHRAADGGGGGGGGVPKARKVMTI